MITLKALDGHRLTSQTLFTGTQLLGLLDLTSNLVSMSYGHNNSNKKGDRVFVVIAPCLWNQLLLDIGYGSFSSQG